MIVFSDLACLGYNSPGHPERPYRVEATHARLQRHHPDWLSSEVPKVSDGQLLRAHSPAHLHRLEEPCHFDADTAYHDDIAALARLSVSAGLAAMDATLSGQKAFSLMRPPGHHATRDQAMGFCYLNTISILALEARARGLERVAIWDFDAHHGNGTEAILMGEEGIAYVSAHQSPCYPGTGEESKQNCWNYPVAPYCLATEHMDILRVSWEKIIESDPQLVLVSAGFDAYENDPITQMSLRREDFRTLGKWIGEQPSPAAAILEGGYSDAMPDLVEAFLEGWQGQ